MHFARKLHCNMHDLSRFDVFFQLDTTLIDILSVFFSSRQPPCCIYKDIQPWRFNVKQHPSQYQTP